MEAMKEGITDKWGNKQLFCKIIKESLAFSERRRQKSFHQLGERARGRGRNA